MFRESIVVIIIVIMVVTGNIITQKYTKNAVSKIGSNLEELKQDIEKEEIDNLRINDVYVSWKELNKNLSLYIEHDELEKVEESLRITKANIESEEYSDSIENIEKCKFLLEHIEDKNKFSIKNIF